MERASSKQYTQIGGLVFYPDPATKAQLQGVRVFVGIAAWVQAGSPDSSVIYDLAGPLADAGVPVLDATLFNGVYVRSRMSPPTAARVFDVHQPAPAPRKFYADEFVTLSAAGIVTVPPSNAPRVAARISRGHGIRVKK